MHNSIRPFVHGGMLVLGQNTPARMAARAMEDKRVGSVVVSDETGRMVGLVTDRDLSCLVVAFGLPGETPLKDVMTADVESVDEGASLQEVVDLMIEAGIRRVPVVQRIPGGRERCVGMVTLDDLIADQAVSLDCLSRIVRSQIRRHSHRPAVRNESRAEDRKEQTLNRFYNLVTERSALARSTAEEVSFYILSTMVKRLPYTGAVQFISQLPKLLQEDLLGLRAGPDKSISVEMLIEGLKSRFGFSRARAVQVFEHFWEALTEFTGHSGGAGDLLGQLPSDFRDLFLGTAQKGEKIHPPHELSPSP